MRGQKKNLKISKRDKIAYVQDWLDIEDIKYGMIILKNGVFGKRYIKIMEIMPLNYHLRSTKEKNMIIDNFKSLVKIAPQSFEICLTSMDTDTSEMIGNIKKSTFYEPVEILDERNKYIKKIKSTSSRDSLRKRCLLVFEYEGGRDGNYSSDINEIAMQMEETVLQLQNVFNRVGNRVIPHENENKFLAEVLYRYLNKKSIYSESFEERINRIYYDSQKIQETTNPLIDVKDYFMPRGIDDRNPEFIVIDGIYHTYMYITPTTYPVQVIGGWIDIILNYGGSVDVSLHFKKRSREQELNSLKNGMKFKSASLMSKKDGDESADTIANDYRTAEYIRNKMKNQNEDLYDSCILIDVMATTYEKMKKLKGVIKTNLRGDHDIYTGDCFARCSDAEKMILPLNYKNKVILKKASRNFLTSSIASTYPFTQYELFDPQGVLFGINTENRSLVSVNIFNTHIFNNANMMILGSSGAGKSFLEQLLGRHMRLTGIKVMYVLPMKGHEYRRGCEQLGGQYIKLAPGSKTCINIFEIRPENIIDESLIEGTENYIRSSLLTKKLRQIKTFLQLLLKNETLSIIEESKIDSYLISMYKKFGITDDDNSIYMCDGQLKKMPTFTNFYEEIKDDKKMETIQSVLLPFINGSCQNMNGQTNVDTANKYLIFDVDSNDIPESLHPAFLFIATDICYDIIKQNRTEECVLFMDEVWKMMINDFSCKFVFELVKIVRGYGGSCVIATQDIGDFFSFENGKYGKQIVNNTAIKIVLKMEYDSVKYIQGLLNLNDTEKKKITQFETGNGMLLSNKDRLSIYFKATEEEIETFSTDINQLKKKVAREKEKIRL